MPPEAIIVHVDPDLAPCVPDYLDLTKRELEGAVAAFAAGDLRLARTLGHNLKGSGSSFGIDELTRIGARLEAAATEQRRADVEAELATLSDYLERLRIVP